MKALDVLLLSLLTGLRSRCMRSAGSCQRSLAERKTLADHGSGLLEADCMSQEYMLFDTGSVSHR